MSSNIYFLVQWIEEEDSWDVLPSRFSVKSVQNPCALVGTVCDFYWKKGEESSPCHVLAYGTQNEMEKKRSEVAKKAEVEDNDDEATTSFGVGRRPIKKPARLQNNLETSDQAPPQKKKKHTNVTPLSSSTEILAKIRVQQENKDKETPACRCAKYDGLKTKYSELKTKYKDVCNENADLLKYKDLSKMIKNLKEFKEEMKQQEPNEGNSPSSHNVKQTSKVDIGHGILMERGALLCATQSSEGPTKLVRSLFRSLFKVEEVVGKSITGRKSNAHLTTTEPKEQLDPQRIGAIIDFTMKKFPNTSVALLRQSLANKVKELNKIKAN
ncbi:uncharacterized protein LOC117121029 [Anneissia japonica]|uniref:uncharacterized protein LOC117121029 n=1 Tax=Anneissia japonica TaxID=1529436 RepID=UPI0014257BA8|nr:uncharacterized protein LOC117121029 [Anneissia japonica]